MLIRLLAGTAILLLSEASYAYIDPGTGSIMLQMLIGGVTAAFALISLQFQRIKIFFRNFIYKIKNYNKKADDKEEKTNAAET